MKLTEEQNAFRDAVHRMVEQHVVPIAAEIDETDRFPEELIPIYGDMGLLQLWVPEEYGGPGGNVTMVCLAREEIAKVSEACALMAGMNNMFALPLMHFGNDEQKRRFLPLLAKGRTVTAIAISEPDCGSDVGGMRTRAVRDGDSYVLNGQKQWCTFGSRADYIMMFAKSGDGGGANDISAFIVDVKNSPGLSFGRNERKMGMKGTINVPIYLDNVRVPVENLLGQEGKGFRSAMRALDLNRPAIAAASVGLAQGALDAAFAYAQQRRQFKRPIVEFQGIQFMLADMKMQIEAARALVYECARIGDAGDFDRLPLYASMAKCFASDVAMKVTTDAVQVFGGYGYVKDYPVERMMRDAKLNQIFEGTNQIQRIVIAREMMRAGSGY
ncbi:acyl-CoA dehydrogenase family protein [Rhodopseudomonas sp. P2A-2r]|uniref:acyl-CoA dehydrogenase family protein n=1 Tax=Rhodopseudomonas sp. P2A-2r TaxID=2991972 RepID=UPI0022343115|nr:acyl-CoA dehydrogenase family protein [Rhodopseudomonas sp. P2A-2r]UZE47849.1 acyl-CoA dehydrogenase family protein [Rhodopseudomonas sp. P2A-2r]